MFPPSGSRQARGRPGRRILLASLVVAVAAAPAAALSSPRPARRTFHHPRQVDNRFYPLRPGTQFVLVGSVREHGHRVPHSEVLIVSDVVKRIDGLNTVVVWDRDYYRGTLGEGELTFQAQDDRGAVWNLGEYPEEFSHGTLTGAPDTWIAGIRHSRRGVLMPARPRLGMRPYRQGWAPSVGFADMARTHATNLRVCVPAGCYRHVLETEEGDPTDRSSHQFKYYAPGVGTIKVGFAGGGDEEQLSLVSVRVLGARARAAANRRVLAIDRRGYRLKPHVYGRTPSAHLRAAG